MTSRTGNKGFTLIEVMAAGVILALGTLLLQGGLLRTAHLYGRYSNSLKAGLWADNRLWEARSGILFNTPPITDSDGGSFILDNKPFNWDLAVRSLPGSEIYSAEISVRWTEGGVPMKLRREIHAARQKKPEGTA